MTEEVHIGLKKRCSTYPLFPVSSVHARFYSETFSAATPSTGQGKVLKSELRLAGRGCRYS